MKHRKFLAVVLAAVVILSSFCSACTNQTGGKKTNPTAVSVSDYGEIYRLITQKDNSAGDRLYDIFFGRIVYEVMEDTAETETVNSAAKEYSQTNIQSEGIDEGDNVKTDGKYIYILGVKDLTIIDPNSMKVLSSTRIAEKMCSNEMYLCGSCAVVVYDYSEYSDRSNDRVHIKIYDISDPTGPKCISELSQSGTLTSSRMCDGVLYTVSQFYAGKEPVEKEPETFIPAVSVGDERKLVDACDILVFDGCGYSSHKVITSVKIESPDRFADIKSIMGQDTQLYVSSQQNMYIACRRYESETSTFMDDKHGVSVRNRTNVNTQLARYELRGGEINYTSSGTVPGAILNQFSMDEYNGYFRIATTKSSSQKCVSMVGYDYFGWESETSSGIYVLDKSLAVAGSVEGMGETEHIKSVRFDGDIGYLVTFRQTDPLFAVDLSDPTSPTILSALKIPGFSSYLHLYDDGLLMGLGYDADEETGWTSYIKLSMFDISSPTDVTEKHTFVLDGIGWSEATRNHKAIIVDAKHNIIGFEGEHTYFVFGYSSENGFEKRAEKEFDAMTWLVRGLYIGDEFFLCTDHSVTKYRLDDLTQTAELEY